MGLSYSLQGDTVVLVSTGAFDVEGIGTAFREIVGRFEMTPRLRVLVEDRGSGFNPSDVEIREIMNIWANLDRETPLRIALHVTREVHFGLGRMAMSLSEPSTLPFRVFRDREAALRWLAEPDA